MSAPQPTKTVTFNPEAAQNLPPSSQNQSQKPETWTDLPIVQFYHPQRRGSPLRILKLLSHNTRFKSCPCRGAEANEQRITILSESSTHITLRLSSGLSFTLTEPLPGCARIRSLHYLRDQIGPPEELQDPQTVFAALPRGRSTVPPPNGKNWKVSRYATPNTTNLHLSYSLSTPFNGLNIYPSPLNPHLQYHEEGKLPHPAYIGNHNLNAWRHTHETAPHLWIPRSVAAARVAGEPAWMKEVYSLREKILVDAERALLGVSLLLEMDSCGRFEELFCWARLRRLLGGRLQFGGEWRDVNEGFCVQGRTVRVYESVIRRRSGTACVLNRNCTFTVTGMGTELVEVLGWLDAAWEMAEGLEERCGFWDCRCPWANLLREVVEKYRPEEFREYEAERLRREIVEDGSGN
ncbi:hypothetical protein BJ508DRAFT_382162 [Ascobolus immersus RN42]|uniref:Uncharacterized protein n=1 Tax=Ascobolus immersus RN42 TaxID=1160509 RepID=A0A3N4H8R2_ASCIM|nr:hypothetical protein BJ508DRAFT_382162 [Ascobolus immersus RN42]